MAKKFTWHRNPAERTFLEKCLRKIRFPNYPYVTTRGLHFDLWDKHAARKKRLFPVRWFFSETLPDVFNTTGNKFNEARDWVRWRTYDRYHVVKTDLKPGYNDKDEILLQVNFKLLRNYVEVELATMMSYDEDEEEDKRRNKWRRFKTKLRRFFRVHAHERNPELGVRYLQEEIHDPSIYQTKQAAIAKEKLELYHWWMVVRPAREDLFTTPLIWKNSEDCESMTRNNNDEYRMMHKLEDFYFEEDQEMLIRLIKIRSHLWT